MKNLEIKKTTLQIFDKLYEYEEFAKWWDTLSDTEETKIENEIQKIIEERLACTCTHPPL
jgi:hypothetical protein